ncbi:hypothetical protein C8F01DRAFT_1256923 [Mycena amicta]|nr:hypothetical protein C8F01DRAFT_1256923 [Mycena amicta]
MTRTYRLHVEYKSVWEVFLEIPAAELEHLTRRPLKWLNFMGWQIYGRLGHLSATAGGVPVEVEDQNIEDYYFISPLPPRYIDIHVLNDRTSNSSHFTARTANFRTQILARDQSCLITGIDPLDSQACHLVPHAKGDDYISALSDLRADKEQPVIQIGDIRNGFLLYTGLHRAFGDGDIAILQTPNPYLLPEDIPHVPETTPGTPRHTIQHIAALHEVLSRMVPHGQDLPILGACSEQPSEFILHFIYAAAVLKRWGTKASSLCLEDDEVQNMYYDFDAGLVSEENDNKTPTPPTGTTPSGGTSSLVLPASASTGRRRLSHWMDVLLYMHVRPADDEPEDATETRDMDEARERVVRWLGDAGEMV